MSDGDFSALEIRNSGNGSGFHYFFDTRTNRLITDFVLEDRPQVATLCQVTLIKKDDEYSPRIRLWKKDKTKVGKKVVEHKVPETELTKIIKATVDTGEAYRNFWKVIHFLQSFSEVSLPDNNFRVVTDDRAQLAKSFEGKDKQTILEAVRIAIGGSITEEDLRMMSNRKAQLGVFEKLLNDADFFESEQKRLEKKPEAIWQHFFESNPWIFGYGLHLIACEPLDEKKMERITTGANIFTGAGKRSDAVMRSKGYISSLAFCEIKTHKTPLLEKLAYRPPDVYQASKELSGGLSQVQKTVSKALLLISNQLHELYEDDGTPTGIQVSTTKPRQVLVIGHLNELTQNGRVNPEKLTSFELYRNSIQDVEVITFDELYERACFIVRDS
ncbi:Shedu immune nuclease family protein [Saccharopolyspora spinosa]|uniref:Shedu immune nuclease family protein n=1 Tax=Saccharopolyspora spinosa TaxID=60894 RepID=UPI001ED973D6|nr:Shedu immune nuclease family protein [Saccharopolyspora spinosa]